MKEVCSKQGAQEGPEVLRQAKHLSQGHFYFLWTQSWSPLVQQQGFRRAAQPLPSPSLVEVQHVESVQVHKAQG